LSKRTVALTAIAIGFFLVAHFTTAKTFDRQIFAIQHSNHSIDLAATGWLGTTLIVSGANRMSCRTYLDHLSGDRDLNPQVRQAGFTKVSCSGESIRLQ
jgi:hypothetical protein